MQRALEAGPETGQSATKVGAFLAAGIALAGAGLIVANPATPALVDVQQPAVQLANTTAENLDIIQDLLAGPNPIFTALGELGSYYGQVASTSFDGVQDGLEIMWSGGGRVIGLENLIPQVTDFLQQGDTLSAWNLINNDILYNMNGIFQPLFDHVPRGTTDLVPGVLGLGTDMTRVMANVQEVFGDFNFWKTSFKYLFEPVTGFQFALTESLTGGPVDGEPHVAQDPFDALLNGYQPWDSETGEDIGGRWWGLLTPQGTFSYFLDFLPGKIADALTENVPADDVAAAAAVDPGSLSLFDGLSFDGGALAGLFDGLF